MWYQKLIVLGAVLGLSACYVVPMSQSSRVVQTPIYQAPIKNQTSSLTARLYPNNAIAKQYGTVQALVTSDQNGHGTFQAAIGGEQFSGDATRMPNSRRGRANGSAVSGRYVACEYEMNSTTLGAGTCQMSTGAVFSMHISAQ